MDIPFRRLRKTQKRALIEGTPDYYGVQGFFDWLETKTYKMPVRVYLSRYRGYSEPQFVSSEIRARLKTRNYLPWME